MWCFGLQRFVVISHAPPAPAAPAAGTRQGPGGRVWPAAGGRSGPFRLRNRMRARVGARTDSDVGRQNGRQAGGPGDSVRQLLGLPWAIDSQPDAPSPLPHGVHAHGIMIPGRVGMTARSLSCARMIQCFRVKDWDAPGPGHPSHCPWLTRSPLSTTGRMIVPAGRNRDCGPESKYAHQEE